MSRQLNFRKSARLKYLPGYLCSPLWPFLSHFPPSTSDLFPLEAVPLPDGSVASESSTCAIGVWVNHSAPNRTFPSTSNITPAGWRLVHDSHCYSIIRFGRSLAPRRPGSGKLGWRGNTIPRRALSVSALPYTTTLSGGATGRWPKSTAFGSPHVFTHTRVFDS